MKRILLLTFLMITLNSNAQQTDLFTNTWYLTQLSIDGTDYITPPTDTSSMPPFTDTISINYPTEILSEMIVTYGCNSYDIGLSNLNDQQFDVEFVGSTLEECQFPNYSMYDNLYVEFYGGSQFDFPIIGFNYTIIENADGTKALVVTNPIGNIAYYLNTELTTKEIGTEKNLQLVIHQDELIIQGITPIAVEIYSIQGKLVLKNQSFTSPISINHFLKGIYILKVKDKNGKVFTRKFIK